MTVGRIWHRKSGFAGGYGAQPLALLKGRWPRKAKIFSIKERLAYAKYWRAQHDELAPDAKELGERDFKAFRATQDFAHHVGDILALFADTLSPLSFEDFLKYGFADPPDAA
jgi:hypothetical protein